MNDFLVALGLMAVVEGVLYAAAPGAMKRTLQQILEMPEQTIRLGGLGAMVLGVAIVWLVRG
jgi:uncharacterized protein YjeT (DUF2065 family)